MTGTNMQAAAEVQAKATGEQCLFVKADGTRCKLRARKTGKRFNGYCVQHQSRTQTRRGWGTVRKLTSGRLHASYVGPDLQRHNAPTTFLDRDAATAWLNEERQLIERDEWTPPVGRKDSDHAPDDGQSRLETLKTFAPAWVEQRLSRRGKPLTPRTRRDYTRLLESKIYPHLGDIPLCDLRDEDVRSWYRRFDKTPTEQAHAYQVLRTVLNSAVEAKLIDTNPCRVPGGGSVDNDRTHVEVASMEQLEVIVGAMPQFLRLAVLLSTWCALRLGEVTALRRDDLKIQRDQDGIAVSGTLRIVRSVQWIKGVLTIGDPKTRAGVRTIHIPPHLLPAVEDHLTCTCPPGSGCNSTKPIKWMHAQKGAHGLLFPSPQGTHLHPRSFGNRWMKARQAAGRPDLHFHDLRHLGATLAAQSGATTRELMARLGHTTARAAMRYQHAAAERDKEIARRLSALAGGVDL